MSIVTGTEADDTLEGSAGADTIEGLAGNDSITAGDGDDLIEAGDGEDTVDGGTGNDSISGAAGAIYAGEGDDLVVGTVSAGTLSIDSGDGADRIRGFAVGDGVMVVQAGDGDDNIRLFARDTASVVVSGGAGSDLYSLREIGNGQVTITDFQAGPGGDVLSVESLLGDSVGFSSGNPFAEGLGYLRLVQDGSDTLLQWDRDGASASDYSWQTIVTLKDTDATSLTSDNFASGIAPDGSAGIGSTVVGTAGQDTLVGSTESDDIQGLGGSDIITGSGGADLIDGGEGADTIYGGGGNDTLNAGDDADGSYLNGGAGDDVIVGSAGNDYIEDAGVAPDGALQVVQIDAGAGDDTVWAWGQGTLLGGEGADLVHGQVQTGVLSIDGSDGADTIVGGATQDGELQVQAGAGDDDLQLYATDFGSVSASGGTGSDVFRLVEYGTSTVTITDFEAGEAGDVLDIGALLLDSSNYTDGNPFAEESGHLRLVQNGNDTLLQWDRDGSAAAGYSWQTVVTLAGTRAADLTSANFSPEATPAGWMFVGTEASNVLTGDTTSDRMEGLGGNDTLYGEAGDDTLLGGAGNDNLYGGDDNDSLDGGSGADNFIGGAGNDTFAGGGHGTGEYDFAIYQGAAAAVVVNLGAGYAEAGVLGTDTLVNIDGAIGTAYADTITGSAGDNLHKAIDLGVNFFDTADMYGWGANERLLGRAFRGRWADVILATKFAVMRGPNGEFLGLNGEPEYIRQACDQSLQNLGVESIDLYYMHRQDPKVEIEEIVGAMSDLVKQGKVKHLGLCEVDAQTLRRAHAVHPISALQTEYSLWSREPEQELFDVCEELGITFVAYSPLGRGFLTGAIKSRADLETNDWRLTLPRFTDEAIKENLKFVEVIDQIALSKKVSKAQVALAWVLSQNDEIISIPGTRNIQRLEENLGSFNVELTEFDLTAIQKSIPSVTIGTRY